METCHNQQRVKQLLSEAVATLCKNLLSFQTEITVEGLLGITVDKNNIVLVNIQELVSGPGLGNMMDQLEDDKGGLDISALDSAAIEKALGQDQLTSGVWNTDMDIKLPENVLAELLKEHSVKPELFQDEPKKTKKKKTRAAVKKEPPGFGKGKQPKMNGIDQTDDDRKSLPHTEESPRSRSLANALKYLDERDTLLSMDHDDQAFEDFPQSLGTQTLDYESQLSDSMSPLGKSDLFEKVAESSTSSVKEERDDHFVQNPTDFVNSMSDPTFLPGVLEHNSIITAQPIQADRFPCRHCGSVFSHKRSLWRHEKSHKDLNSTWKCDICRQVFSRKDILLRHRKQHGSKSEKCPFCSKVLSRMDSIQRHIATSHEKELLTADLTQTLL